MFKTIALAAIGATAVAGSVGGGWIYHNSSQMASIPEVAQVHIDGMLKPNNEIMISSPCAPTDSHAKLTTSFGATADLYPAADRGELIGFVTAPNNIGPGPADGYHTVTVTCDSGLTGTVTFPSAGNGDQ
ncbi:hypothetical protein [Corynebacterium belfantii]|uniref:hypothetical protein n=1 Tax=Corynebacterium belfantii TaxID=2014537 RepID=UPI0018D44ED9|nr:hypothetical protein [Corynebacterium belfantii]MBG9244443.1 hypothetical protein [Corynebacterium belfantii]